ncbi:hypothetical protein [Brevibacillus massiliensis]|uniref:hypothetical protein n=1 Tax=Brevibacillus massiliensis TaxID=1118054 RepID=UPI0002DE1119|nr:hypothetical protein [Brevibacillus massiliensis]
MENDLKKEIDKIEIPNELRRRTELGIQKAKQELSEQKHRRGLQIKRLCTGVGGVIAASVLAFTLIIAVEPGMASSVKGFFKDIVNWKGAVTGVEYLQATNEIKLESGQPNTGGEKVVVPITLTLLEGNHMPYRDIKAFTLGEFMFVGSSGETLNGQEVIVQAITDKEYDFEIPDSDKLLSEEVSDTNNTRKFQANLLIQKDFFEKNNHITLKMNSVYGHKKGDYPLKMNGEWEAQIK